MRPVRVRQVWSALPTPAALHRAPLPDFSQRTGYLPVEVFTYDDANDRYICPHSQELRLIETCRCGLYTLDSPKLFYPRVRGGSQLSCAAKGVED